MHGKPKCGQNQSMEPKLNDNMNAQCKQQKSAEKEWAEGPSRHPGVRFDYNTHASRVLVGDGEWAQFHLVAVHFHQSSATSVSGCQSYAFSSLNLSQDVPNDKESKRSQKGVGA